MGNRQLGQVWEILAFRKGDAEAKVSEPMISGRLERRMRSSRSFTWPIADQLLEPGQRLRELS